MTSAGNAETFFIVRPPGKDRFGDPLPGGPIEIPLPGCLFAPGSSVENLNGANQTEADGAVYAPAGTVVLATDKMRVRGDLYEVVGKPADWGASGVVIDLSLVTG